jgi:hypothetical protein
MTRKGCSVTEVYVCEYLWLNQKYSKTQNRRLSTGNFISDTIIILATREMTGIAAVLNWEGGGPGSGSRPNLATVALGAIISHTVSRLDVPPSCPVDVTQFGEIVSFYTFDSGITMSYFSCV